MSTSQTRRILVHMGWTKTPWSAWSTLVHTHLDQALTCGNAPARLWSTPTSGPLARNSIIERSSNALTCGNADDHAHNHAIGRSGPQGVDQAPTCGNAVLVHSLDIKRPLRHNGIRLVHPLPLRGWCANRSAPHPTPAVQGPANDVPTPRNQPPKEHPMTTTPSPGTIARIRVTDGATTSYPVVERVPGGWQSGEHHYPDAAVSQVTELMPGTFGGESARDVVADVMGILCGDLRPSQAARVAKALADAGLLAVSDRERAVWAAERHALRAEIGAAIALRAEVEFVTDERDAVATDLFLIEELVAAVLRICDQVEQNPTGWGGSTAVSLARSIRRALSSDTEGAQHTEALTAEREAWLQSCIAAAYRHRAEAAEAKLTRIDQLDLKGTIARLERIVIHHLNERDDARGQVARVEQVLRVAEEFKADGAVLSSDIRRALSGDDAEAGPGADGAR